MAAFDVERQDPLSLFRSEVGPADLARARQEWATQAQQDHHNAMVGWSVMALIGAMLVLSAVLHRRKIARAADAAIVSGLATGVRAARAVAAKRDGLVARVLAKAAEKTSRQD